MRTIRSFRVIACIVGVGSNALGTSYYFPKFGTPIFVGDKIVFAGPGWKSHRVICIAVKDGKKVWEISDPAHVLQPALAFDGRVIITAGSDIEALRPQDGSRQILLHTGYQQLSLQHFAGDALFCAGESNDSLKLAQINTNTWQRTWEATGVERVIAEGKETLICEWQSRRRVEAGVFRLTGEAYVGLSKSSGREQWRLGTPLAVWLTAAAVDDCFVVSLEDSVLCLQQRDGKVL